GDGVVVELEHAGAVAVGGDDGEPAAGDLALDEQLIADGAAAVVLQLWVAAGGGDLGGGPVDGGEVVAVRNGAPEASGGGVGAVLVGQRGPHDHRAAREQPGELGPNFGPGQLVR